MKDSILSRPLRFAMVGVGGYGEKRRASLRAAGGFEMLGGIDINPDALTRAEVQENRSLINYPCLEDLVQDPQVEAVFICTPAHLHVDQAMLAARAGKAIFTEKPLGHDLEECRRLVQYCEANDIAHGHGFTMRFEPQYQHVKRMLEEEKLGRVVGVSAATMSTGGLVFQPSNWRFHPERNPGGPLFQCGIHKLDLLHYLFGAGRWISGWSTAHVTKSETLDSIVLLGEFAGIPTTFHSHYVASYRHSLEIYGTHGTLLVSDNPPRIEFKETDWEGKPEPLMNIADLVEETDAVSEMLRDFSAAVRERRQPQMNGRDGLAAIESIHQAIGVCDNAPGISSVLQPAREMANA